MSGHICLIKGPMFSGKSTELRTVMHKYRRSHNCVVVRYSEDNRYSTDSVMTHSRDAINVETLSATRLHDIYHQLLDYDIVGVDEGQFFSDLADCCIKLAKAGKTIYVSALSSTARQAAWPAVTELEIWAHEIRTMTSVCEFCKRDNATLTVFKNRDYVPEQVKQIGGSETYVACCLDCM